MTEPPTKPNRHVQPHLGVWDVASITVGIIIGSGIYSLPPLIAAHVASAGQMLWLWIAGGCIAMVGALCYSELAAAYPHSGGTYVYLNKAFGRLFGFMYCWCEFWIVRPGNIGAMAFIFIEYLGQVLPSLDSPAPTLTFPELAVGCGAVLVLGLLNLLGVKSGKRTQMLLTVAKVLGLIAIFVVSFLPSAALDTSEPILPAQGDVNWSLAMVFVLFAYGGWNETAAVAAEVRDPQKNMLRGLLLGTGIVVVVYLLVNLALLRGLGFDGIASGEAVVATLMTKALGPFGGRAISMLVCISCLGAINGMLFTGARLYYALGREQPAFGWLGHWHERLGTPVRALALQTLVAIVLLCVFSRYKDAFQQLVNFTVPLFWSFLLLVSVAVVVLRLRDPHTPRPFRLPLFPLEPLIFFAASALMVCSGVQYLRGKTEDENFWFSFGSMVVVVLSGIAIFFLTRRRQSGETR